jgi:hypothetical protein
MIGGVISLWTIGLLAQSSPPVSSRETQATPTFEKDILAIVENHCQQCHRPGQIGPFSFLDYRSPRPWARSIKQAVLARTMPPWYADPGLVHFENGRSLSKRKSTHSSPGLTRAHRRRSEGCTAGKNLASRRFGVGVADFCRLGTMTRAVAHFLGCSVRETPRPATPSDSRYSPDHVEPKSHMV